MKSVYWHGKRKERKIAITFDDGPAKETEEVLEVLRKYDAKATFFILGKRIAGREYIIEKIKEAGHEFGNHTYSHKKLWFKSPNFVKRDIEKCDEELVRLEIKTNLFRFPYYIFGLISVIACLRLKKKIIFSDVISYDFVTPMMNVKHNRKYPVNVDKIVSRVLRKTKNGSIINFHDYLEGIGHNEKIGEILEEVLLKLKEKGFQFVTVSELLN